MILFLFLFIQNIYSFSEFNFNFLDNKYDINNILLLHEG